MTGHCDGCGNTQCICLSEKEYIRQERRELFKAVALKLISFDESEGWDFSTSRVANLTESILEEASKFAEATDDNRAR